MKSLIFFVLFTFTLSAKSSDIFTCKTGNEDSICDQKIIRHKTNQKLTALSIEYVGWCGSMGPYTYSCSGKKCSDGAIFVEFHDENSYRWENRPYKFKCEFVRKKHL
jgi:hypothetical protein